MTLGLAGIFVGGKGTRMGGIAKGLLRTGEGTTIVERWRALLEPLGLRVVLVGAAGDYSGLGLEIVADQPAGIGPLGGLLGLLRRADQARALAVACDMPFVSGELVGRLLTESEDAPILAPRRDGRWEPLCARYDASRVLAPALALARTHEHSLQRLLRDAGAVELTLEPREVAQLRDWDTLEEVSQSTRPDWSG
jgi:molybdopterin-guanine dinucleotide biosynthesis protein A